MAMGKACKKLIFTSAIPGEGKMCIRDSYNEGKKKSPDPFTYSFAKNTMRLVIVLDSDP